METKIEFFLKIERISKNLIDRKDFHLNKKIKKQIFFYDVFLELSWIINERS
jgi:negative regulator of genetic competence, sporulation and motility